MMQRARKACLGYFISDFDHNAHSLHKRGEGPKERAVRGVFSSVDCIGRCGESGSRQAFEATRKMFYRACQGVGRSILDSNHELAGVLILVL